MLSSYGMAGRNCAVWANRPLCRSMATTTHGACQSVGVCNERYEVWKSQWLSQRFEGPPRWPFLWAREGELNFKTRYKTQGWIRMDHGCPLRLTGAFDTAARVLRCSRSQQLSQQIKADMVDSLLKQSPFSWTCIRHLWADDDQRTQE